MKWFLVLKSLLISILLITLPLAVSILIFLFYWKFERVYLHLKSDETFDYLEANIIPTTIWVLLISLFYWLYFIMYHLDKS